MEKVEGKNMYQTLYEQSVADRLFTVTQLRMKELCGDKVKTERITQLKNNDVAKDGVMFREIDSAVAPTIYFDNLVPRVVKGELTINEAVDNIVNSYFSSHKENVRMPELTTENFKEKSYVVVINKERNCELLKDVPYYEIPGTDLTLVMRWGVETMDAGKASFLIKENILAQIGLTQSEAFEIAIYNTKQNETYTVQSIRGSLISMGMPEEMLSIEMEPPLYIVINQSGLNGATGVFINKELRAEIRECIGGDFIIIPSSLQEVLVMRAEDANIESIKSMIHEVNSTTVSEEEILSDYPFYCNDKLQLSIAGMETMQSDSIIETLKQSNGAHI